MKKALIFIAFVFIFSSILKGQDSTMVNPKVAMQALSFLEGKWSGSGWQMGPDRQKNSFQQTEDIRFDMEGQVLLIRGLGKQTEENDKVIHDAFAMINYNARAKNYDFRSYTAANGSGNYSGQVIKPNTFVWTLKSPQATIKYTITINEKGQWHEIGEYVMGDSLFKIFEMTLDKVE